jgi:TolB-like protein
MAPEVIRGAAADARSDIWSLGVVLYELLSGKRPFPGATPLEVTAAILRDPMPALPRHVPDLTAIVGRCLSKDPATRYQHAGEVRAALEAIQTQIVRRGSAVRPKSILSVAVLPIVNASLDPNLDYLSDGITESIINSLSQLPKLKVMARSTVFRYKERAPDPQTIGRDLGVRAVLTGQLRHIGDRLMISAELVDASDGAQIWGEQYNRTLTDVLEVQQALSAAIVEKLSVRPTSEQKKRLMRQHTASSVRTSTT